MKHLLFYLFGLLFSAAVIAEPGPSPTAARGAAATKRAIKSGTVRFEFKNITKVIDNQDSALVIFDRFDHTGAGVVYQMFATNADGSITVPAVPAGKYFVTIECRGVHRDHVEMLVTIKDQKNEKVRIKLGDTEAFSKDNVRIPAYSPAFADMAILKSTKSTK